MPHLPPGIPDLNVPLIEEEMEDDCVIVDSAQAFDLNVPHEVEVEEENIVRVESLRKCWIWMCLTRFVTR